jgi:hypothetical protein
MARFRYQHSMRSRILILISFLGAFVAAAADAPATFQVSEFTFTRPPAWEWIPLSSSMRKAQLKINGDDKKSSAEVVFFHFGVGQGGNISANVDRWLGQFQEPRDKIKPKTEDTTVNGHKVSYISADGTYMEGPPGGQKTARPGYALRGAIVESAEGNIYIKLTGPVELANKSEAAFRKMVESGLQKK